MKKTAEFNVLSSKVCAAKGCTRRIKQSIVDKKPSADLCYRCFMEKERGRGHHIKPKRAKAITTGNIDRATTEAIRHGRRNTRVIL